MSTFVDLLPQTAQAEFPEAAAAEREAPCPEQPASGSLKSFAEGQIRGLVQQVFLPGWPKPSRQVVISAVDQESDVLSLCMQVAHFLSEQASGTTCVIDANLCRTTQQPVAETGCVGPSSCQKKFGILRDPSQQLSSKLWFMPRAVFCGREESAFSAARLRGRLAELRLEFDYTILYGPAVGVSHEAELLAGLCDGLILVLEANFTRRAAAQKARQMLASANVHLLGTVLTERTFPIPEALYRRL